MNKFGILCFTVAVFAVCHVQASPMKRPDAAEYQNCKKICGLCDCVGFYCGDECICECHNKDDENLNCIEDIQNDSEKLAATFEVLIQGPSGSRFVRSLVAADGNAHKEPIDPTYVSTISIFQPKGNKKVTKREAKPDIDSDVAEALANSGAAADAATIDEKTSGDAAQTDAGDDKKGDEKVGSILPIAPLLTAKLLPLKVNLGLIKQGINAKLLPLGVGAGILANPVLAPGLIAPKLAAIKARIGLGLLPIAPLAPII